MIFKREIDLSEILFMPDTNTTLKYLQLSANAEATSLMACTDKPYKIN